MADELLNNDPAAEGELYAPLVGGEAQSTVNGKNAAIQQFDSMQEKRKQPVFAMLTEIYLCSVELFQIFARFITEIATGRDDKALMRDTCMQYISGFKSSVLARFPKNVIWSTVTIWYTKLRAVVYKKVNTRMIALGLSTQDKSDAIDRGMLLKILTVLMVVSLSLHLKLFKLIPNIFCEIAFDKCLLYIDNLNLGWHCSVLLCRLRPCYAILRSWKIWGGLHGNLGFC
jgi:hypothetical protein